MTAQTEQTAPATFREWMRAQFDRGELADLATCGADAGWPGLSYTRDCVALYERYAADIWEMLRADADDLGAASVPALIAGFNRAEAADDPDGFRTLLTWYAAERVAAEAAEADDDDE